MPGFHEAQIAVYRSANSISLSVRKKVASNLCETNILASQLYKTEKAGQPSMPDQLWIATPTLISSCEQGPLGTRPLFIAPLHSGSHESGPLLLDVDRLVDRLLREVTSRRIFSVFGPEPIVARFTDTWTQKTGISVEPDPYYAANLTYVTLETLSSHPASAPPGFDCELRKADGQDDIEEIAQLCYEFAQKSVRRDPDIYEVSDLISLQAPFILSREQSKIEAKLIVRDGQCWIHRISRNGGPSQIACIVVVGRDSGPVAAITKVFTHKDWRSNGCAERLVWHVCNEYVS